MNTAADAESRQEVEDDHHFPAYGPIEATLAYLMFYVVVDRVTPAVVQAFSEPPIDLAPSFLRFGLALALWFVLALTVVDQARRQFAALGVGTYDVDDQLRVWSRVTPSSLRTTGYLLALAIGTAVAAATFDPAVDAFRSLIPVATSVDAAAFDVLDPVVLATFFVAYGIATHSLDRLVIDAIRVLLAR